MVCSVIASITQKYLSIVEGWFGMTTKGKGGVYRTTDLVRQTPGGERKEEECYGTVGVEDCEGLPGVYSTIWCLCYKTNKLKKRREKEGNRPS
jgi:hypothetical protein